MASQVFEHSNPDRFIVGTVGLPGDRTFYLQAKSESRVTTVKLEKEQVEMLSERMAELLDMVRAKTLAVDEIPATALPRHYDNAGLSMPVDPEFRVGTMSLGWDTGLSRLLVECYELSQADAESGITADPDDDERAVFKVVLSGAQAREFSRRADQVVGAGREDCPFCSLPLDPGGHLCPRANGVAR
ncbi:DUF3090 family protein [Brevibacterium sp. 50QC2O2]|jgi:uncharacterized repeat protein (TIGR03847 family)|uniref:DUF3090 family protein n=1 Tax=Brevibacterium TaxID=1696 RepID=UPI00211C5CD6|nr:MULTISPECIES: DUF3090 family protein [unclassified Brevibacterium]MCQ9366789.1 DUF3090 family protein [Brevibacterium sp. 91QC2O2]MCQ9383939.1 DUF3090 family protein [Brevibacterium sp. 68QC2CO]MCQ9388858.1 DUF3090 family protein [Brevibacterium sp. 50QC2O2]